MKRKRMLYIVICRDGSYHDCTGDEVRVFTDHRVAGKYKNELPADAPCGPHIVSRLGRKSGEPTHSDTWD